MNTSVLFRPFQSALLSSFRRPARYIRTSPFARSLLNMKKDSAPPIVWVDCEMTGLDVFNDHIIEICCLVTDGNLNLLDPTGFEAVIHQPAHVMENMNEWCVSHHGQSGLTKKVEQSTYTASEVESELLAYLKPLVKKPRTAVMAGNSIHQDRFFLMREFPRFIDFLHYRMIDVSSIKEIGHRHNAALMQEVPRKCFSHTARADVLESIDELRWYYDNYLIRPKTNPSKSEHVTTHKQTTSNNDDPVHKWTTRLTEQWTSSDQLAQTRVHKSVQPIRIDTTAKDSVVKKTKKTHKPSPPRRESITTPIPPFLPV